MAWRWLAFNDNGEAVGRIAAFINPKTAHEEKQPVGGMGFFECIDDQAVAEPIVGHRQRPIEREWNGGYGRSDQLR